MLGRRLLLFTIGLISLTLLFAPQVYAFTPPSFPSCSSPQGTLKAQYSDGIHGIVGELGVFEGEDSVYTVDNNRLIQCFCPAAGVGIQTNWLKAESLSSLEIDDLLSQGWVNIPNGALWGLEDARYLAKNLDFSCSAVGGVLGVGDVLGISTLPSAGISRLAASLLSVFIATLLLGLFLRKKGILIS